MLKVPNSCCNDMKLLCTSPSTTHVFIWKVAFGHKSLFVSKDFVCSHHERRLLIVLDIKPILIKDELILNTLIQNSFPNSYICYLLPHTKKKSPRWFLFAWTPSTLPNFIIVLTRMDDVFFAVILIEDGDIQLFCR